MRLIAILLFVVSVVAQQLAGAYMAIGNETAHQTLGVVGGILLGAALTVYEARWGRLVVTVHKEVVND